ncbi:MAG TPA: hypothetical protein VGL19_12780 [Polyangiaceae bacterium]|jgi:hypothetical protein
MSDPPRLLEETSEEVSDSVRRLLVAGIEAAPPTELGAQVWAGLAPKLPSADGASGPTQSAAGGTHAGGLLFKAALAVVGLGAFVLGARALLSKGVSAPLQPKPAFSSAPPMAPAPSISADAVEVAQPPTSPAPASVLPTHAAFVVHSGKLALSHAPPVPASASSLPSDASEESRLVAAARDALRSGNSAGALALLGQAQQRFGAGVLGQEREALTIEALAKSGQRAVAQARGQAFLKSYANSPYAARIRAIVGTN